jgi:hypothetical protein
MTQPLIAVLVLGAMIITLYLAGVNAVLLGRMTTDVQAGLMFRQLTIAAAAFPERAAEQGQIREIGRRLDSFPWNELPATGGHDSALRLEAMALVRRSERQVKALHSAEEQNFSSATIDSLDAKQNSRTALGVLVGIVIVLGAGGLAGEGGSARSCSAPRTSPCSPTWRAWSPTRARRWRRCSATGRTS